MGEPGDEPVLAKAAHTTKSDPSLGQLVKKRWRAWLRAIHRDVGYLAVGFTVIYALSGIAMNHVDDWNYNYNASERSLTITPVPDDVSDEDAGKLVAAAAAVGTPGEIFRAGDEVRLSYANGTTVTAIGANVTVQEQKSRFFFRAATWLHAAKGKAAWKYIADAYAVLLLYLAISGLFMIKGRLGLKWRGMILVAAGFAAPITYLIVTGGPEAQKPEATIATTTDDSGIRLLPPDESDEPAPALENTPAGSATDDFARPPILKQPPPE